MDGLERLEVSTDSGLEEAVSRAVEVLEAGGVLGHPTDRLYGIGGAVRPELDLAVARLKGRELDQFPVLRIASDRELLHSFFPDLVWSVAAERLAERFWPGALTLILPEEGTGTVAVRVEGHPVTRAVLDAWGAPIGSTSLNATGETPASTSRQAFRYLQNMPDIELPVLLLDAGDLPGPPPSTLVSLVSPVPRVLRVGTVPVALIEECLTGIADL